MLRLFLGLLLLLWHAAGLIYPKASRVQWFANRYRGSRIRPNILIWHTTETGTWPAYGGGATAPNMTILVDLKKRAVYFRQHFDSLESARALRNLSGGVETNTLNAFQIELVGTCSRDYQRKYGYLYWPDAPDWVLAQLGEFMAWFHQNHDGYPLRDAAPRGWKSYPGSYANGAGQRMSYTEWGKATGNAGHQHVPENVHGDPGDLDMAAMISHAKTVLDGVVPKPDPAPVKVPKPSRVARARGLFRDARRQSLELGTAKAKARARKIAVALDAAPKS